MTLRRRAEDLVIVSRRWESRRECCLFFFVIVFAGAFRSLISTHPTRVRRVVRSGNERQAASHCLYVVPERDSPAKVCHMQLSIAPKHARGGNLMCHNAVSEVCEDSH